MEKIIREVEEKEYKPIIKKVKVTIWVASDGREFSGKNAEKDCSFWEGVLEYNKKKDAIKKVFYHNGLEGIPVEWYFPTTEEELSIVSNLLDFDPKRYYLNINDVSVKDKGCRKPSINEWIGGIIIDNGDHKSDNNVYTLDYVILKIERFMGIFP